MKNKDKAAVELGRKGGRASARRLSARQRAQRARRAAQARWGNQRAMPDGKSAPAPRKQRRRRVRPKVEGRTEQQWLRQHGAEYVGQWVALDGDRLLGRGDDAKTVYEEARRLGVTAPFLVKVEPRDELPFAGW